MLLSLSQQAKLRWACRRGMLELDLLLQQFLDKHLASLDLAILPQLERLLTHTDPVLYAWLMQSEPVFEKEFISLVQRIRSACNLQTIA